MSQPYAHIGNPRHIAMCSQLTEDLTQRYGASPIRERVIARKGDWQIDAPTGLYFLSDAQFRACFEPADPPDLQRVSRGSGKDFSSSSIIRATRNVGTDFTPSSNN